MWSARSQSSTRSNGWSSNGGLPTKPARVEAEVKEDAPGHGVIGDEGDDLEPAAAVRACEVVHGEDLLQQVGPGDAVGARPGFAFGFEEGGEG
jgi:hypothetical protein